MEDTIQIPLQDEQKQAGVIKGTIIDEEYWVPEVSEEKFQQSNEKLQDDASKKLQDKDDDFFKRTLKFFKLNRQPKKQEGAVAGTSQDEENKVPDASRKKIPLSFLKRVGMFEISPTSFDQLTLTAEHLSFVEFFASVGILLNLDIEENL